MSAAGVVDIYEQHIKDLPTEERLRLLALIADELATERMLAAQPRPHTVMEFYGVGQRSWDGSDAQEFVNKLRDEWDERKW